MPTVSSTCRTRASRSGFVPLPQMLSGSETMSRTLRRGLSELIGSWKIICMRGRNSRILSDGSLVRSCPSNTTEPDVGRGSCMMARPVVDFPQPDSPTSPSVSPSITSSEIPETAFTLRPVRPTGNSTTRSSTRNNGVPVTRRCALPVPAIGQRTPAPASTAGLVERPTGYQQRNW